MAGFDHHARKKQMYKTHCLKYYVKIKNTREEESKGYYFSFSFVFLGHTLSAYMCYSRK